MTSQSNLTKYFVFLVGTVSLVVGTVSAAGTVFDKPHHVLIGPAKNITVLLKGPTNIVISWLPPHVYANHDVTDPNEVAVGDEVNTSKLKEGVTLVAQNKSDDSPEGLKRLTDSLKNHTSRIIGGTGLQALLNNWNWLQSPLEPEDQPHWECKPFSFFADYTVEVKDKVRPDEPTAAVQLKDEDAAWDSKKIVVKFDHNHAMVPFEEGCLEHYQVVWQEMGDTGGPYEKHSMIVPPTLRTANLTDLKPDTSHNISVIAVFKSDSKISGHPIIYVKTSSSSEDEECKCVWPGTLDNFKCNATVGEKHCKCKMQYEGTFCERCAPGYYRTGPRFPCHACPCYTHGRNRTTCSFVEGFLKCHKCEVGYTGSMCHLCSSGFYRYRKFCVPCQCHGNAPKEARTICLPSSGMCTTCLYNTTGFNCESCKHGYVGDPITYKNCTLIREVLGVKAAEPSSSSSSGLSPGVVITITLLVLLALAAIGFLVFRRYSSWRQGKSPAFWTVGMNPGGDAVDINSVHNDDARLDDDDDGGGNSGRRRGAGYDDFHEGNGEIRAKKNKYQRLVEQA